MNTIKNNRNCLVTARLFFFIFIFIVASKLIQLFFVLLLILIYGRKMEMWTIFPRIAYFFKVFRTRCKIKRFRRVLGHC